MTIREDIKSIIRMIAKLPLVGRFVLMLRAFWRGPQTRVVAHELMTTFERHETHLAQHRQVTDGYGAAIRGMEVSTRRHELQLNSANTKFAALDELLKNDSSANQDVFADIAQKIEWIKIDNDNIRSRLEFIRKETMFELRRQLKVTTPTRKDSIAPIFVSREKIECMKSSKLNLGCGHIAKQDYINVDSRALPGVDLVADVTDLPFEASSIDCIYSAHLVEHFSDHALRNIVLPHWHELLHTDGTLVIVAPDAKAMMEGYAQGDFSFDEMREVIFGGQEYEGDFHFNMLTPDNASDLLQNVGFSSVQVVASARRNGQCLEFEITAKK